MQMSIASRNKARVTRLVVVDICGHRQNANEQTQTDCHTFLLTPRDCVLFPFQLVLAVVYFVACSSLDLAELASSACGFNGLPEI